MNIIEEIRKFVEDECKKPTSKYGYEPYIYHFAPMVKIAEELATKLNADKEIVVLSAWLHDIGSIVHGRENHHETGAEIAGKKLKEFNYPDDRIELVKRCILNHRGSRNDERHSIEEQIIAEADSIDAFNRISGLFKAALVFEKKDQQEALDSVRQKLENKWNQLTLDESKDLIRAKYEAVGILLGEGSF
ncbi:HD domain-containing protein [Patescibacteria group bacterium]|nr:HD domain-containing protein [Patescibacteria group bacterium]